MSKGFKISIILIVIAALIGFIVISNKINGGKTGRRVGSFFERPIVYIFSSIESTFPKMCRFLGGKKITKCGIACRTSCTWPMPDAGKSCSRADQCSGLCVVDLPILDTSDVGAGYEPAILQSCRRLPVDLHQIVYGGIQTAIMSFECPDSVAIPAKCQKYIYSDNETFWRYEDGKVGLMKEPWGM